MPNIILNILPYILLAVVLCIPAYFVINFITTRRKQREEIDEMETYSEDTQDFLEVKVQVIDKRCNVSSTGTKVPQVGKKFVVTFMTDQGQTMEYEILEQAYLEMGDAKSGTLLTINGNFYGFCPDEVFGK